MLLSHLVQRWHYVCLAALSHVSGYHMSARENKEPVIVGITWLCLIHLAILELLFPLRWSSVT